MLKRTKGKNERDVQGEEKIEMEVGNEDRRPNKIWM
jgi:hypothetical protein